MLAATLYQGNPDRNHKHLEYCINCEISTPYAGASEMLLHMNGKFTMGKLKYLFCRKVRSHFQFRGEDQGMKQTYLYLWYPLFQAEWDRCDQ